jgi:hypothetical protein
MVGIVSAIPKRKLLTHARHSIQSDAVHSLARPSAARAFSRSIAPRLKSVLTG